MFFLFCVGINIVLEVVDVEVLSMIISLALVVPSLALGARRLHDIGKSGWWQLLWIVPIVGWIIIIVFWATETTLADNQYGAPARPKVVSTAGTPAAPAAPVVPVATAPMAEATHSEAVSHTAESTTAAPIEVSPTESSTPTDARS